VKILRPTVPFFPVAADGAFPLLNWKVEKTTTESKFSFFFFGFQKKKKKPTSHRKQVFLEDALKIFFYILKIILKINKLR
jgi:hypothetical protein